MTKAVIYTRWSPRPGHESDSCDKQLERGQAYCKAPATTWAVASLVTPTTWREGRQGFANGPARLKPIEGATLTGDELHIHFPAGSGYVTQAITLNW